MAPTSLLLPFWYPDYTQDFSNLSGDFRNPEPAIFTKTPVPHSMEKKISSISAFLTLGTLIVLLLWVAAADSANKARSTDTGRISPSAAIPFT